MSLKGTETAKNLMFAFANEAQAVLRYTYAASQAKKDGYVQMKNIFEETARNESEHAKRFYKFLREEFQLEKIPVEGDFPVVYGDTVQNLKGAIEGENAEAESLYPHFADVAEKEGFKDVARHFREIAEVEEAHRNRFQKLLSNIENDRVFKRDTEVLWKCNNCGYIHRGKTAPKKCPACDHPQSYFEVFVETY